MQDDFYDDFDDFGDQWEPGPAPEEREDPYVEQAKADIVRFFEGEPSAVVYARQLQVKFEKSYFHWVTARAANELVQEGRLREEQHVLHGGSAASFLFHRKLRYRRRRIRKKLRVLREYADASVRVRIGEQAELLFLAGFAMHEHVCKGRNVRKYGDRVWKKSGHDLDFVLEGTGGAWGCEVKNTMDYIEREELDLKVEMCRFLKLRPMFIMRYAPKTYIEDIRRARGYAMVFEYQVWPFGQEDFVKRVRAELGLPVDCPRRIPDGIFVRFEKWLAKKR